MYIQTRQKTMYLLQNTFNILFFHNSKYSFLKSLQKAHDIVFGRINSVEKQNSNLLRCSN